MSTNSSPTFRNDPQPRSATLLGRAKARVLRLAYAAWSLASLATLMTVVAVLTFMLPGLARRRAVTRRFARLWLRLAAIRVHAIGLDGLPQGSCVLVANHSSYIDGLIMKAVLPPRFSFVVKREAASTPVLGSLLRRNGAEFVDRHTRGGRQRDARRVVERAEQGHSLVFFPEGTFDAVVGLKRFHIGAFVAAARAGMPVVPAVIHGARRALPHDSHVPHPGEVFVEVLGPVGGHGESPEHVRDVARTMILERLGEPDLAPRAGSATVAETATN